MSEAFWLDVPEADWLLTNHRPHHMKRAAIVKRVRAAAGWEAKATLDKAVGPVAVYAQAHVPKGTLPDADAIAILVKAAVDGVVDAGIIPDDNPATVRSITYLAPKRDRTLTHRRLRIIITDQHVPF